MRTRWGVAAAAAALAGCLGSAPALLTGDAGPDATKVGAQPGTDATTDSGMGVPTDDGSTDGPLGDGGVGDGQGVACFEGGPCSPGPCELGATTCSASGAPSCASTQNVTNGKSCDAGAAGYGVCNQGACQLCNAGGDCTEAGSCQQMNVVCTSGSPVCAPMGNVTDGKPCGSNLFCNSGSCAPCTPDAGCAPTTNKCNVGTVSCVGGQVVCNDQMTPAPDGKSCGTNMVCKGGSCGPCVANVQCTPPGQQCHTGLTSCATGTSVCVDMGNVQDNTLCTGTNPCYGSYACRSGMCTGLNPVTCTASDQCHSAGTCDPTTGACSNPVATGASCSDGNGCTQTDTCNSAGMCVGSNPVSCTSDPCHNPGTCTSTGPTTYTCSVGTAKSGTVCGSACVDLTSSDGNCGACGRSCGGGGCTGSVCGAVTLGTATSTTGAASPQATALGPSAIYLAYVGGTPGGTGVIEQCPLTGCPGGTTVFASGTPQQPLYMTANSTGVYWTSTDAVTGNLTGYVMGCPQNSCPGGTGKIFQTYPYSMIAPYGIAADSTNVYWTVLNNGGGQNTYVQSCPVAGCSGSPSTVFTQTPSSSTDSSNQAYFVGAGGGYVFFLWKTANASYVTRCPPSGCGTLPNNLIQFNQSMILYSPVADSTNVYWLGDTSSSQDVEACGINGCAGTPTTLAPNGSALATDGAYVYWANSTPAVVKCAITGCGQSPSAVPNAAGTLIGVDGSFVYFMASGNVLKKVAK